MDIYGLRIRIDGELYEVEKLYTGGYLPMISIGRLEFYLAESSEQAGEKAKEYWQDMAKNDSEEFACLVGTKTLIQLGLGQYAGPGSTQVTCLEDWLDLWVDTPEEQWASYDGTELDVDRVGQLARELGFVPTVAYRHN